MMLFDHFLEPNNMGNMASSAEAKLTGTLYNGEKKIFTWETYVRIHIEQHSVLNGLKNYGYAGIDDSSKVLHLLKWIKIKELDIFKTQVMTSPTLRDDSAATVELYSTFIKKMKAENPQLNVSEVSFSCGKGGKNSFGKWGSSGISNISKLPLMTFYLRSMDIMHLPWSKRIHCDSSDTIMLMLEMVMAEVVLAMEKAMANALP
jgi:hypothetical protein